MLEAEIKIIRICINQGVAYPENTNHSLTPTENFAFEKAIKQERGDVAFKVAIGNLQSAVEQLRKHADTLNRSTSQKSIDQAQVLLTLYTELNKDVKKFNDLPSRRHQSKAFKELERSINDKIKLAQPALNVKRTNAKTIIKNILTALTGVGALILAFRYQSLN